MQAVLPLIPEDQASLAEENASDARSCIEML
jgi:hypothetical protein